MPQLDNLFTSIWHDTTTGPGTPLTGLSATITIREKPSNTIVVNNEAMTEVGLGEYDYIFTGMNVEKSYSYVMNPNSSLAYIVSGFVDPRMARMDANVSDIRGGGGFSINYGTINNHTTNKTRELKEFIEEQIKTIPEIDLSPIIDKIDEIEMPEIEIEEFPEDIKNKIDKITQYIDQEQAEKEKEEKEKEEERKREEEAEKKEIQAIVKAIKEVDKEVEQEIIKTLKEVDKEHEENIIKALNSL